MTGPAPFQLLGRLWLHELDAAAAAPAAALLGQPLPDPAALSELAQAYAGLFLLNVYPYGTVFTDPSAELNGPAAHALARRYAAHGYQPPELHAVGAPDHLGLALGFLGHLAERGPAAAFTNAALDLLAWAPILCLAVQREPDAHPFYQALAAKTSSVLLDLAARLPPPMPVLPLSLAPTPAGPDEDLLPARGDDPDQSPDGTPGDDPDDAPEVRLRDVLAFWLAPAHCGLFLSRARLGRLAFDLGLPLAFGARYDVARRLFEAAGDAQQVPAILTALQGEVEEWSLLHLRLLQAHPAWSPFAQPWQARLQSARRHLAGLRAAVAASP